MVLYNDPTWGRSQVIGSRTTGPMYRSRRLFKKSRRPATTAKVARMINNRAEKKYHDIVFTGPVTNLTTVTDLVPIPQSNPGATDTTRIGDKIRILSMKWVGQAQLVAGDIAGVLRMIIFQWHPDDTFQVPTLTDVLQYNDYNSPYNHDRGTNFSIIYDKTTAYNFQGVSNRVLKGRLAIRKFKFCKQNISYTAATINGLNKFYMIMTSDLQIGINNGIGTEGTLRVTFTDS